MTHTITPDPYFDDEDEENEDIYRQLLKQREPLPPCDTSTLPVSSLSERCSLCSREEAENILKSADGICSGNFIVRPSVHPNHPYSLSVLANDKKIYHFQIGLTLNKYLLGPLSSVDLLKAKTFPTLTEFLKWYLTSPIRFQDNNNKRHSIQLQLYSSFESTRF
ncbi:hypothetical protein I4U23_030582 [Adineta vaga]|nr:hypothetical protein I4U23_030582 [Adineta vaga]